MTPRQLQIHLDELPEELLDIDMEYVLDLKANKEFTHRIDEHIVGFVWRPKDDDGEAEVLLMGDKTFEKFLQIIHGAEVGIEPTVLGEDEKIGLN